MNDTSETVRIDHSWYQRPKHISERTAAGGIIVRKENQSIFMALAREKGESGYILPKGGVEPGESILDAALREIEEEAGFKELHMLKKLGICQRLNFAKTHWLITHYFLFITQEKEGIPTESKRHDTPHWFLLDSLPKLFWPEQQTLVLDNLALIKNQVST